MKKQPKHDTPEEKVAILKAAFAARELAKTCASLVVEMRRGTPDWTGRLLRGIEAPVRRVKPRGEMRYVRLHTRLG